MARSSWWSLAGAALVVLLLAAFVFAYFGGGSAETAGSFEAGIDAQDITALRVGTSRDAVEERLGRGQDALEYGQTGPAVEPMDAECAYYAPRGEFLSRVAQLCYRDGRLVSKRLYRSLVQLRELTA